MRHGSAFKESESRPVGEIDAGSEPSPRMDAQTLGGRLIAFARIAAALHHESATSLQQTAEPTRSANLSLGALLGRTA